MIQRLILFFISCSLCGFGYQQSLARVYTVPKSGTYYLMELLKTLTHTPYVMVKYSNKRQLMTHHLFEHFHHDQRGHNGFSSSYIRRFSPGRKDVFLVRNLRDVLLSEIRMCDRKPERIHWHFDHKSEKVPSKKEWTSLTLVQKVAYVLRYSALKDDLVILKHRIEQDETSFLVRYEDIIGTRGGGDDTLAIGVLNDLMQYLGFRTDLDYEGALKKVYGDKTPFRSFSQGKVNTWQNDFTPEIESLFELAGWKSMNRYLGYE